MFERQRIDDSEKRAGGMPASLPLLAPLAANFAPLSFEPGCLPIRAWLEELALVAPLPEDSRDEAGRTGEAGEFVSASAIAPAGLETAVAPAATGTATAPAGVEAVVAPAATGTATAPAVLIDQIRALEELKAAASAAQARAAAAFDTAMRQHQAAAGVERDQLGKGVGAQIGFARRESPHRGTRLLGLARILTQEMPHTLRALTAGIISEWRATILVRETACLALEDRRRIDQLVAGNPAELQTLGDRQLIARVKALAYGMDPASVVNRAAKAVSERFVSCRPAPDTMTYLTGLLPVAQGVEVYATLSREADRLRAAGDARGRGQIMADTLVERITGRSEAGAVRVEVQLIMTESSLLATSSEPAALAGYGVVPAQFARDLVRRSAGSFGKDVDGKQEKATGVWLRRLYTAPSTGQLVAMDSKARLVPAGMARFIAARDQTCRMPWCGAPLRHFDHIQPHSRGGPTNADNVQGLCEACNQAKEAPGWSSSTVVAQDGIAGADGIPSDGRHTVETVTPTGHRYRSEAPAPPGARPRAA